MEVSIDEPLNVDWDGNELLLSDISGTDEDIIYKDIVCIDENYGKDHDDPYGPRENDH